ncbi:protein of unknown function [Hyphomicrobium sp. 1Nfss2.1]
MSPSAGWYIKFTLRRGWFAYRRNPRWLWSDADADANPFPAQSPKDLNGRRIVASPDTVITLNLQASRLVNHPDCQPRRRELLCITRSGSSR